MLVLLLRKAWMLAKGRRLASHALKHLRETVEEWIWKWHGRMPIEGWRCASLVLAAMCKGSSRSCGRPDVVHLGYVVLIRIWSSSPRIVIMERVWFFLVYHARVVVLLNLRHVSSRSVGVF